MSGICCKFSGVFSAAFFACKKQSRKGVRVDDVGTVRLQFGYYDVAK